MKCLISSGLLIVLFSLPALAQTRKTNDGRPEVGKFCKLYRAGEGLIVSLVRVGAEANNETLIGFNGFDHPWDGKIFKAKVVTADGRQEFTIQNNGRPFVVLVMRERYGQSTLFVSKYGTEQVERPITYSQELSGQCDPDIFLSQYLNQQAGKK
jgi:hypothetical protein